MRVQRKATQPIAETERLHDPQPSTPGSARSLMARWAASVVAAIATMAAAPAWASGELVLIPDGTLVLVLIVLFALLIVPVNSLIFKPIFHALDERASRIEGARQRATHIGSEADHILGQYELAIREARSDAEATRKDQIREARDEQNDIAAEARGEAEQKVEQARAELTRSLEDARQGLRTSAESLARDAAQKILGRAL